MEKSRQLEANNPRESFGFAQLALNLANNQKNDSLACLAYQQQANALRGIRHPLLLQRDSLAWSAANRLSSPDLRFDAVRLLVVDLLNANNTRLASPLLDQLDSMARRLHDTVKLTNASLLRSFWFFKQFKMKESLQVSKQAALLAANTKTKGLILKAKYQLAESFIYAGKQDSGLAEIFDAIALAEHSDSPFDRASSYSVLAFAFQVRAGLEKALEYYLSAEHSFHDGGFRFEEAQTKLARARVLISQHRYEETTTVLSEAEQIFRQISSKVGVVLSYNHWGQYYSAIGKKAMADSCLALATLLGKELNQPLINLANDGYTLQHQIKYGSFDTILAARAMAEGNQLLPPDIREFAVKKIVLQNRLPAGATDEMINRSGVEAGLNLFSGVPARYDSAIALQYKTALLELETKYRVQQKEDSIRLIAAEKATAKLQVNRQRWIMALTAGISLLLAVLWWLQRKGRQQEESLRVLEQQNLQKAEEHAGYIEKLQADTIHRVDNMLMQVNSLVYNAKSRSHDKAAFDWLDDRLVPLNALYSLFKKAKDARSVDMQQYLSEVCSYIREAFEGRVNVTIVVDAQATLPGSSAEKIGLIVNELVFNAFKYAFQQTAHPVIEVSLRASGKENYQLKVSDNGTGIDAGAGTGRGLQLVKDLVQSLKGDLSVVNKEGAVFELLFM
jgi:two-component sensor histidine kinase